MSWIWLNLPLGGLIFLAVAGIPLWMVIRRPDLGPGRRTAAAPARSVAAVAVRPRSWAAAERNRIPAWSR
jgi:hypothetical protein